MPIFQALIIFGDETIYRYFNAIDEEAVKDWAKQSGLAHNIGSIKKIEVESLVPAEIDTSPSCGPNCCCSSPDVDDEDDDDEDPWEEGDELLFAFDRSEDSAEDCQGPVVCVTPKKHFDKHGGLSDEFSEKIMDKMSSLGYGQLMDSTYEPLEEGETEEEVKARLTQAGLVYSQEMQDFLDSIGE